MSIPTSAASAHQQQFLERLRRFVLDETISQRRQIELVWSQPLPARVAAGKAIEGVAIADIHQDGRILCTCSRNISRFREGDILCLNRNSPFFQPNVMLTLEEDEETRLLLTPQDNFNWGDLQPGSTDWVLDEGFLDLSHYILDALNRVGDSLVGRTRILPLLQGETRPQFDHLLYDRGLEMGQAQDLNWSQSEALAGAYASSLSYLIQGPPGTGKTLVLAHLAQALVSDGERVLVTALTHRAINNALNKLHGINPDIPSIKIGPPSRADDLLVDNYATFGESPVRNRADGYVIGATPFAPYTSRLAGVEFDTVIFDEASQITLPLAIMGMLTAQRYIFIGDQQQLPPVLVSRRPQDPLAQGVFHALSGEQRRLTMLDETYRLNTALTEWPSRHFYEGALRSAPQAAGRQLALRHRPQRLRRLLDPAEPLVFWDMDQQNTTTRSHREASAVADLILVLLDAGMPPQEIGVVAPYRAQGREIRHRLHEVLGDAAIRQRIVVDTVERMQGQEREVIILSLTTSSAAFAAQLADFFFQPQRLNVAVTRSRSKLIIVGSRHVLQALPADPEWQEAVQLLADLLNHCTYIAAS